MNKKSIAFILYILIGSGKLTFAHTTIIGHVIIENFNNEIIVTAQMDKRPLTSALMHEADCSPKEMISKCGSQYIQDRISLIVNGNYQCLNSASVEIRKEKILFKYVTEIESSDIKTISIQSNYLLNLDDHAILRVVVAIKDHNKSYNLRNSRQKLQINL